MSKLKTFFDKIYSKYLNKIKLDDALHAYVSSIIFIFCYQVLNLTNMNSWLNLGISTLITFAIGYLKEEIIDKRIRKSQFSKRDLYADIIGIIIGCLLMII